MKNLIHFNIHRGETHYVAECVELPIVSQAESLDELAANIKEAVGVHLEGEDQGALGFECVPSIVACMKLGYV